MAQERRVVVTGVGLVSPLAIGTEETWKSLLARESGAAPITQFDASRHSAQFACEVKGFDPSRWVEKKEIKKIAPPAGLASRLKVVALYAPQKAKQTVMIGGSAGEIATELVRRLREEARAL